MCEEAQEIYSGDYVEALIAYVESEDQTFNEKHNAIGVLGEIADKRALPTLEKLYTGKKCDKPCRHDEYICQYQLEKAIRFCRQDKVISKCIRFCLTM